MGRSRDAEAAAAERATEWLIVRSAVFVLLAGLVVLGAALLAWRLRATILILFVSVFIAVLLNPFVRMLCRHGLRRVNAVFVVYGVLVILALAFGYLLFHPLVSSASRFAHDLPAIVRDAQHGRGPVGRLVARLHLENWVRRNVPNLESAIAKLSKPAFAVGRTVVSGIEGVVTIAFISLFVLLEGPRSFEGVLGLLTAEHAARFRRVTDAMAREVTGFMIGDLATSVIAGVVVFVTLEVTHVPFATLLAVWVGLVDFLPLVGGLLAGVPTVGLAFLHSTVAGIVMVIVFLVYQQVENHVLYPLIVSRSVRLSPLWVLLAVLVGAETGNIIGATFGAIAGAILAVPAAGSIQVAVRELLVERQGAPAPRSEVVAEG
ncbi:MAG: AI-2E family transporter [Acidimicrobiales bacterium]